MLRNVLRRFGLPLVLPLVLIAASFPLSLHAQQPITQTTRADRILVVKSTHTMTLYAKGSVLRTYRVSLGRGLGKAKHREGDHETPEGLYVIDAKNAHSRFHRALHVSYPNADDRRHAAAFDLAPGGDIMIHGIENGLGWLGSLQRRIDWTDGCIALTDPEIEEVWKLVPTGTPIEIRH